MRILITSVGTSNAVNLIRYFHKLGHKIYGTDINEYGHTAGSLLCDRYAKVPFAVEDCYIDTMVSLITEWKIDLFIPIHDIEVFTISKRIEEITCECVIPKTEVIEVLRDKYICNCNMNKIGIPVAPMYFEDKPQIKRILRNRIGNGSNGIRILDPGDSIQNVNPEEAFIQEFIEGNEYTIDALCDKNGNPIYIVPRERVEVKAGVATKVKIEENIELINYCKKILYEFKLPGFSNIQFIKDKEGKYWFIEVNWRFAGSGSSTLAVAPKYLQKFIDSLSGIESSELNSDVKWNTFVTRYYEELVYEEGVS